VKAPEICYRFAGNDFRSLTFETVLRNNDTTANAASIFTALLPEIAKDRILVVSNICAEAVPTPATGVTSISFIGRTPAGLNFSIMRGAFPETADTAVALNWQGEVWISGEGGNADMIDVRCFFVAAGVSNRLICSMSGIIVPRGNVGNF